MSGEPQVTESTTTPVPATTGCSLSRASCTPSRPGLHEAQNAWLAQIDSLRAPDRKTHELIRMVCTVILRNPPGVQRHAMLAAEVGATWEEVAGSIVLTEPAFGAPAGGRGAALGPSWLGAGALHRRRRGEAASPSGAEQAALRDGPVATGLGAVTARPSGSG